MKRLALCAAVAALAGCIDPNADSARDSSGALLLTVEEITLHDGVRCVVYNGKSISCDWTSATATVEVSIDSPMPVPL